jgi:hypothetical protein
MSMLLSQVGGEGNSMVSVENLSAPYYHMKFLPLPVPTKTNLAHTGMPTMWAAI